MSKKISNGVVVSPGIRIGKAYVFDKDRIVIPRYKINASKVEDEIKRFEEAIEKTKSEIEKIQLQIAHSLSKDLASIFTSHLMVLEDPLVYEKTKDIIRKKKRNAEWVINDISLELINSLDKIEDEYLKERIIDVSDIHKRLIGNLQKSFTNNLSGIDKEVIVFSSDLTPSDTAMMNKNYILAFVTDKGGKTSHTAIMARALEIPAIVATMDGTSKVKNGDTVIVDAVHGEIIINPTKSEINEYKQYKETFLEQELQLAQLTSLPSKTLDSKDIFIYANIEIPEEMEIIKEHGAQGIGLFRSEFLFLDKSLPDEERQFQEYKSVVEFFKPLPVTIRTLDVGGDKIFAHNLPYKERNPFLGCRAIRFSLENIKLFKVQLRAILRASHYGNVKLMFPMITTAEELIKARSIVDEIMEDFKKKGIPFDEKIPVGIMLEVPSAIINADILSKYSDFFSVGTNDLVQYTLAVDRISEKIAYLYNPLNLSILRLLKQVVKTSNKTKTPISICGEIAGEPQYTMVLLGLGFKQLSMSPTYMYQVKKIIRSVTIKECEELAETLLKLEDTNEIELMVRNICRDKFQEIFLA
ncbi:phosphoenolpyruvate--protein phosphotransferase [Spirochaetota bacterium]